MKVISRSIGSGDIESALARSVEEINRELEEVDGKITKAYVETSVFPSGWYVTINIAVSGTTPHKKSIIGINQKGRNLEHAMKRATEKLNGILANKGGEVVEVFNKTVSTPLSARKYTTIVAAINEDVSAPAKNAGLRRARLRKSLELLANDPKSINVSKVADAFGVSRGIIYKDLEELGFKRDRKSSEV
jgi:DNA-binding phage protein